MTKLILDKRGAVAHKLLGCVTRNPQQQREDLHIRMLVDDQGLENLILAAKMVINATQRHPGALGDLAHGGGTVTLIQEQAVRGINDSLASAFTFGKCSVVCHHN